MSVSYKEYLRGLQEKQGRQLADLQKKATKIIQVMGVEKGHDQKRKVARMYWGEDYYQLIQEVTGEYKGSIRLLKGIDTCRQEEPVTDLEESGELSCATELARFCSNGQVLVNGQIADPKKNYVIDLPVITVALGLWDRVLESSKAVGVEFKPVNEVKSVTLIDRVKQAFHALAK